MLVIVPFTFGGALVANSRTELEHLTKDLFVRAGSASRELSRRFADIGAIQAGSDALGHVHRLSSACVGATETHSRAVHQVMRRIAKWLVDAPMHVRMQGNHLTDRQIGLLVLTSEAKQTGLRSAHGNCRVAALLAMMNAA